MARTLFVTIDGQEFTRKTDRPYTHVVVHTTAEGRVSVDSWHNSAALAAKAATGYAKVDASFVGKRRWVGQANGGYTDSYQLGSYRIVPVSGERVTEPKAKKARTASQGPTPGQLNYLRMLAGLEHTPMANGNAASRLHGAVLDLGWAERVLDAGFYAGTQLTAAGRELLGLAPELPELDADVAAAEQVAAAAVAERGERPAWSDREDIRAWHARGNMTRYAREARTAYNCRNVLKAQEALGRFHRERNLAGVAMPTPEPAERAQVQLRAPETGAADTVENVLDQPSVVVDGRELSAGDDIDVEANQGTREGLVLAVLGDEALVEYTMPNGTSALRVIGDQVRGPNGGYRAVSYWTLPEKWLRAIVEQGGDGWYGRPQQSGRRTPGKPSEELAKRYPAALPDKVAEPQPEPLAPNADAQMVQVALLAVDRLVQLNQKHQGAGLLWERNGERYRVVSGVMMPHGQPASFAAIPDTSPGALAAAILGSGPDAERWCRWLHHVAALVPSGGTAAR